MPMISLAIFAAAAAMLLGDTQAASAQSQYPYAAYSYPWCSVRARSGGLSCYYTSWEQCRATMSGIGGLCVPSPYYRAAVPPPPLLARRRVAEHRK